MPEAPLGIPPTEALPETLARFEARLDSLASRFETPGWLELVSAVILSLATVLAAWSAYQATRWNSDQAVETSRSISMRTTAAQLVVANATQVQTDAQEFLTWIVLASEHNQEGVRLVEDLFRPELRSAFDAWRAGASPGEVPPGSPLGTSEYRRDGIAVLLRARTLNRQADESAAHASAANQRSDHFVLVAVIMASVLFFAGIGTKFRSRSLQVLLVALAALLLTGGALFTFSQPQHGL